MHSNERELIRRCLERHDGAWDHFIRSYGSVIRNAAREGLRRATGAAQDSDIEEVAQLVLHALCEGKLATFEGNAALSTWLSVIAIRTALNYARSRLRADPRRLIPLFRERFLGSREDLDEILQGLTPVQRAALRLYFLEGMSRQEIAEILDLSPNSISSLLVRALASARKQNP